MAKAETFAEAHAFLPAGIILKSRRPVPELAFAIPQAKVVLLETGATWLPFCANHLDEHWEKCYAVASRGLDRGMPVVNSSRAPG
jgi:hypothetical protein